MLLFWQDWLVHAYAFADHDCLVHVAPALPASQTGAEDDGSRCQWGAGQLGARCAYLTYRDVEATTRTTWRTGGTVAAPADSDSLVHRDVAWCTTASPSPSLRGCGEKIVNLLKSVCFCKTFASSDLRVRVTVRVLLLTLHSYDCSTIVFLLLLC